MHNSADLRWLGIPMVVRGLCAAAMVGALVGPAIAQTHPFMPRGEFVVHEIDTGPRGNPGPRARNVFATIVHTENALWTRLHFDAAVLARGSMVRITSLLDGEVQELDAAELAMWSEASAFFNGDTVLLELIAGPGTEANRMVIDRVMVEFAEPGVPVGTCGICGGDSRVPSDEDWVGRLAPNGCTASIFNEHSCVVSAGHCMGANNAVHFRVPNSLPNCSPQNPPVADQFPITSMQFQNAGVGADWAVITLGTNNLGQTAFERYGVHRPIASSPAPNGAPVSVWGYGQSQTCTLTYTQQWSQGTINGVLSTHYRALIDVTFGNSGSALIHNGEIIGVVTHCDTCGSGNIMTRVDLPAFANARNQLCPDPPANNACPSAVVVGDGQTPFNNLAATTTGPAEEACEVDGDDQIRSDVWFSYTATCAGLLTVSLCDGGQQTETSGGGFDTKLAVYGATCPTSSGSVLACNKDACGVLSEVTLNVQQGQTYNIRIGGHLNAQGKGILTISCDQAAPTCPEDLDGDGVVDVLDLLQLLDAWGPCGGCDADLNSDGVVDVLDLLQLLDAWGPC